MARPMFRPRLPSSVAVLTATLALSGFGVAPVGAADPPSRPHPSPAGARPERPAPVKSAPEDGSRLIVEFRTTTATAERRSTVATAGTDRIADLPSAHAEVIHVNPDQAAAAIAALRADPNVVRVSVDHQRFRSVDPRSEPYWDDLWGLHNTGQELSGTPGTEGSSDVDIDGLQALGLTTGSPSVVVAVIDDGVDFSHPDLAGRAWTNPAESGAGKETNGIDDDGNGYIDDVHGWDFCHNDNTLHHPGEDYHGTHVAGTIAASLNGVGVVGVAPSISIMALKFIGDPMTCGFDSQALAAIAYAKSFGVRISNNSWGGPGDRASGPKLGAPALYDAIASSGMLFVVAAGNDGIDNDTDPRPSLPATFDLPNVVSVAALDNAGGLADFSDFGHSTVDIAAPGVNVLSSVPADTGTSWAYLSGTSMAAPHVTGTAALVASKWPALAADPLALKARLLASGKSMPLTVGDTVSGKIVDAYRALDATPPVDHAPTTHGFALGSVLGTTTTAVGRVGWPAATDDLTGVAAYAVQVQVNGGGWSTVTSSTTARTANRTVVFKSKYAFRVRARDGAGNWGAYATGPMVVPKLFQESSSLVTYHGIWAKSTSTTASGHATRFSTHAGAYASIRFNGRAFAVVMPKGSTRGSAKLYVDGVYVATIDTHRTTSSSRVIVATGWWSSSGAHTVKIVVVGTSGHARIDLDAIAVMT